MRVTKQPSEEIEGRRPERKTGRLDPVRKEEEEEGGESQTENFLNILNFSFPPSPLITLWWWEGRIPPEPGVCRFSAFIKGMAGFCALQREKRDSSFRNFSATFRTFSPLRHFFPAIFSFFLFFFFFFPFCRSARPSGLRCHLLETCQNFCTLKTYVLAHGESRGGVFEGFSRHLAQRDSPGKEECEHSRPKTAV